MQAKSQSQFCRHKSQRVAGRLTGQGGRPGKTCIDLDNAVVLRFGVQGILHVALTDDADMPYNIDGELSKQMVFTVGQGL